MIWITSKIQSFHPFTFSDISWKFHQNPSISFWFILYTNTSGSLDPDDQDHSQNLITCSLSHLGQFLKISSKSTHDFLSYLSLKIIFHGSRRSRQWSGSLPKFNHIFLLPFWIIMDYKQTNRGPKMTLGQVLWRSVDDLKWRSVTSKPG